jgi:hypothetical protein
MNSTHPRREPLHTLVAPNRKVEHDTRPGGKSYRPFKFFILNQPELLTYFVTSQMFL